ncbi:MAG TPA: hypothetical protein VIR57_08015 [Chloroflexota bacterium]|jgi:hypothetical protein
MTPAESTERLRSGVKLTRNTKGVQPEVHIYAGDEDVDAAVESAKKAFAALDDFARAQAGE